MKYLVGLCLICAVMVRAEDPSSFWKQLTPEERKAAGLDQLTPEQQAALDALAARFAKEGARKEVETVQAKTKSETAVVVQKAREEGKAEGKAEAKAEASAKKRADAGLAVRSDDEVIRTRIDGAFRGWEGRTTFKLQNGQVWQQTDKELRFFPKQDSPEVELVPSSIAGWRMRLVKEGLFVHVKRIQ